MDDIKEDITTILYEEMDTVYIGNGMNIVGGFDGAIKRITKYIEEYYIAKD